MRIIHGEGYSNDDRKKMSVLIYKNIIMGIQIMIEAMEDLEISYTDPNNEVRWGGEGVRGEGRGRGERREGKDRIVQKFLTTLHFMFFCIFRQQQA